jgi:hypothetical protein
MTNYEILRGGHPPRDIYAELTSIEERGKRLKGDWGNKIRLLLGIKNQERRQSRGELIMSSMALQSSSNRLKQAEVVE